MRAALALALAAAASLAAAQAPAQDAAKPAAKRAAQPAAGAPPVRKAHRRATPEQIRRFNELQRRSAKR